MENRRRPGGAGYGTDWLAFAHLVIAVAFWGPLRDPVRNIWVVHFGMIACVAVVPLALIAGPIRGIPWWWQLIDISFGAVGIIPLLFAERGIRRLARQTAQSETAPPPPQHPADAASIGRPFQSAASVRQSATSSSSHPRDSGTAATPSSTTQ